MTDYLANVPEILTLDEAAELLRIDLAAMEQLTEDGEIPYLVIAGQVRILKKSLMLFLERCEKKCYPQKADKGSAKQEPMYLDNRIKEPNHMPFSEGDTEMAKKINQAVVIDGQKCWIHANSMQEFADKVVKLMGAATVKTGEKHLFSDYAWNWFNTYSKPNIETATATTYERQLRAYLVPAFEGMALEDITTDDVQCLFNGMHGAKTTKDKARMVLNQIMDAAVEDKLIAVNPVKSKRVKVKGTASKPTVPYSVEQMQYIVQHIGDVKNPVDRAYLALQALHPLRLEEVLGLRGEDVDAENKVIRVRRAVTHPTRNMPEVKDTKTYSSRRSIGLSALALPYLPECAAGAYLFGGDKPLSYTQVRKMCERIKRDIGFSENITPIRFRTTVLTDLYDQTKDIKLAQQMAGHTTSAMTLRYYVKGRETAAEAAAAVERVYTA